MTKSNIPLVTLLFLLVNSAVANSEARPNGDWRSHGLTEAQRQSLHASFQKGIDQGFIPGGAMLLLHRSEVVFREGFGVKELGKTEPFSPDTPFRIASVTKLHTATVLEMLDDQGLLSLNDPIDKYLPKFKSLRVRGGGKANRAPTIVECLSHTTGFPPNAALSSGRVTLKWDNTLEEVVNELAGMPLIAQPGTKYGYSRLGFMVAGRIAEIVTGKNFKQVMHDELLMKVGAIQSTFDPSEKMQSKMAMTYDGSGGTLKPFTGDRFGKVINPGGGLCATLDGVARVLQLHLNQGVMDGERLVSKEALSQMYIQRPATEKKPYGLGLNIVKGADGRTKRVWHIGASGTYAMVDFDKQLAVLVFTQVGRQNSSWRRELLAKIDNMFSSN